MNSPDERLDEHLVQSSSEDVQCQLRIWRYMWNWTPSLVFPDQVLDDVLSEAVAFRGFRTFEMQLGKLDQHRLRLFASKSTVLYFQGENLVFRSLVKAMYEQWLAKLKMRKEESCQDLLNYIPAKPVCLKSTGNHELFSSSAALIRLHKTIIAKYKSFEENAVPDNIPPDYPGWLRLRPAFERVFIAADVRDWPEFKKNNPGPRGTLKLEVQIVCRLSMLPDDLEENDFQYVENLCNGAETWVKRIMSLEDALEMVIREDSILAEDTYDSGA